MDYLTLMTKIEKAIQNRGYKYQGNEGRGTYTCRRHYQGEFWTVRSHNGMVCEYVEREGRVETLRNYPTRARGVSALFETEPVD